MPSCRTLDWVVRRFMGVAGRLAVCLYPSCHKPRCLNILVFAGRAPLADKFWESGTVTTKTTTAVAFALENKGRFVEELKALLRIPSVSTSPEHVADVRRAAEFVAAELKRIGMENVRLIETTTAERKGHPLVYADWLHAAPGADGKAKPTVLCYGHYDVQPAEPLDEWKSPPFEPTEREGNLYARGAVDDKGQMWMHLKAL